MNAQPVNWRLIWTGLAGIVTFALVAAGGPSVLILPVVLFVYFIPSLVARDRHVPNVGSVFVINLFLGWTFIGWVVALAMAARTAPDRALEPSQSLAGARKGDR